MMMMMMIKSEVGDERQQRERGSVIIAVIGVMAVMMIIGATVSAMTVHSLGFTSSTRAGIQSVAAAESGTGVAEVGLRSGTCAAAYAQAVAPVFNVEVSYSLSATNDTWVDGCPAVGVSAQRIKIVSTGHAAAPGVGGNSSGDVSVVEAIYEVLILPGVHPSGAAMYLYGGVVFKNNGDLVVADGGPAAIQVKSGNVTCENGTTIKGDVVVENGNLDIIDCTINGNAWASGHAKLGTVMGNLTSSSTNLTATQIASHVQIQGAYTASAATPVVPGWVDFSYVPTNWVEEDGTPYKVTAIGPSCSLTAAELAIASDGNKPVIINALACPGGVTAPSEVKLTNDVVIFANKFDFTYHVTIKSNTTEERNLWFITPDNTPNGLPTCDTPTQGDFTMWNGFDIDPTVAAMLYTPCRFEAKNNFTWRGQLYANGANDFKNNTWFQSEPLGLPLVDLDTGGAGVGGAIGSDAELGTLISIRDLASGG